MYDSTPSKGTQRAFVWGMALHSLADAFAHSTATSSGERIDHDKTFGENYYADNNKYLSFRWDCASDAVNSAMKKYKDSTKPSGTIYEFSSVKNQGQFKMINIKKYITELSNEKEGNKYDSCNVYMDCKVE